MEQEQFHIIGETIWPHRPRQTSGISAGFQNSMTAGKDKCRKGRRGYFLFVKEAKTHATI